MGRTGIAGVLAVDGDRYCWMPILRVAFAGGTGD